MRLISSSIAWKLLLLLAAVGAIVLLNEARALDSRDAAGQALLGYEQAPEPGEALQFTATAYCKGTTTASGVRVRSGIAAADPALLPVGSVVNVFTGDERYDGIYTILDTGPKVQGRILDLYIWSCHEALQFGRTPIEVTVLRLGWDPGASDPSIVERLFYSREAARREAVRRAAAALAAEASAEEDPAAVAAGGPTDEDGDSGEAFVESGTVALHADDVSTAEAGEADEN